MAAAAAVVLAVTSSRTPSHLAGLTAGTRRAARRLARPIAGVAAPAHNPVIRSVSISSGSAREVLADQEPPSCKVLAALVVSLRGSWGALLVAQRVLAVPAGILNRWTGKLITTLDGAGTGV